MNFLKKYGLYIVLGLAVLIFAVMYFTKSDSATTATDDTTIVTTPPTTPPTTPTPTAPVSGELRFNIRIDGGYWLPDGDNLAVTGNMVTLNPQGNGRDFIMKPGDDYHGVVRYLKTGVIEVQATYVAKYGSIPYMCGAITGYQAVAMTSSGGVYTYKVF